MVAKSAPKTGIARKYGLGEDAVDWHKQAGHVAEALVVYGRENRQAQFDMGEVFHRNVERLGLAQDAADRWLRDPDDPERYDLAARAEEVTVHYEEEEPDANARAGFRTVRRKAKLSVLLGEVRERHGFRVTGFETRFADPRRLLTEYSAGLRGEMTLFMQAWAQWQEDERQAKLAALSPEEEAGAVRDILEGALTGKLAGILSARFAEVLTAEVAQEFAERVAPGVLEDIIEAFGKQVHEHQG